MSLDAQEGPPPPPPPLCPPPQPPPPPPPPKQVVEETECENRNYNTYKKVTKAFLGMMGLSLLTGVLICSTSIYKARVRTPDNKPMREDCIVSVVSFFKILNIAILSTLAGCVATTACTCRQVLTAQSTANIVNVISITYGAHDLFPHGRGDIVNGAVGSLAAEAALGIYGPCEDKWTNWSTGLNIAFNAILVIFLAIVDIDKFERLQPAAAMNATKAADITAGNRHNCGSIEMLSYFDLRHYCAPTACARTGRFLILICAVAYSIATLVFFLNATEENLKDIPSLETGIACLPLIIAVLSWVFYYFRDRNPRALCNLY